MGPGVLYLGFEKLAVWGWGFGVWGLGFGVWGLGFGVWGLGPGVQGFKEQVSSALPTPSTAGCPRPGAPEEKP